MSIPLDEYQHFYFAGSEPAPFGKNLTNNKYFFVGGQSVTVRATSSIPTLENEIFNILWCGEAKRDVEFRQLTRTSPGFS